MTTALFGGNVADLLQIQNECESQHKHKADVFSTTYKFMWVYFLNKKEVIIDP